MSNTLKNNAASQATAKLYLNDELADVRFVFNINDEVETIPANKAILSALSPVFHAMFFGSLKESKEVKIVDASVEAFKEFLQFFYLSEVTLTMENIKTVARLADKYDVLECVLEYVNACAEYLRSELKVDNICWGFQLALFTKNQPLIEFCEEEIKRSPKEIFASEAFQRCEKEALEHILRLPLTCNITDIFNACMEWAEHACKIDGVDETQLENVKSRLGNGFKLIQFGEMSIQEFLKIHTSYKDLFTLEELQDIMLQLANTEYISKLFDQRPRNYAWDDTKAVECKRATTDSTLRNVQNIEVVSFSSNQPVLLGEIWSSKTYTLQDDPTATCEVKINITQLEDNTFHLNDTPKQLYNGTCDSKSWDTSDGCRVKVVLPKPILIKPYTIYEIQFEKDLNIKYICKESWKPIVHFENGLEIYFHQNPTLDYDNSRTGWISTLKFNKI